MSILCNVLLVCYPAFLFDMSFRIWEALSCLLCAFFVTFLHVCYRAFVFAIELSYLLWAFVVTFLFAIELSYLTCAMSFLIWDELSYLTWPFFVTFLLAIEPSYLLSSLLICYRAFLFDMTFLCNIRDCYRAFLFAIEPSCLLSSLPACYRAFGVTFAIAIEPSCLLWAFVAAFLLAVSPTVHCVALHSMIYKTKNEESAMLHTPPVLQAVPLLPAGSYLVGGISKLSSNFATQTQTHMRRRTIENPDTLSQPPPSARGCALLTAGPSECRWMY